VECKADRGPLKSPLTGLRFYKLRHQFVTELGEAGVPESVIRELAGHVDPSMMRVYSHPRLAASWAAVRAFSAVPPTRAPHSHVINDLIKSLPAASQHS
jgi:integrase